jgi:hypothetical protein
MDTCQTFSRCKSIIIQKINIKRHRFSSRTFRRGIPRNFNTTDDPMETKLISLPRHVDLEAEKKDGARFTRSVY